MPTGPTILDLRPHAFHSCSNVNQDYLQNIINFSGTHDAKLSPNNALFVKLACHFVQPCPTNTHRCSQTIFHSIQMATWAHQGDRGALQSMDTPDKAAFDEFHLANLTMIGLITSLHKNSADLSNFCAYCCVSWLLGFKDCSLGPSAQVCSPLAARHIIALLSSTIGTFSCCTVHLRLPLPDRLQECLVLHIHPHPVRSLAVAGCPPNQSKRLS
jgi:hypothetical protein